MKQQLNARISDATREKLDRLTALYGTQAEVIAVAVDRLWLSHNRKETTMKGNLYTELRSVNGANDQYAVTLENVDAEPYPVDDLRFEHRGGLALVGGSWRSLADADEYAKGAFEKTYGQIDWT